MKGDDKQLDTIFDALANNHRRAIVCRLALQPSIISELADMQKLSLPAIHKHIKVLEKAQLLRRRKSGRCNFLALNRESLIVLQGWIKQFNPHWGSNDESLDNYISHLNAN